MSLYALLRDFETSPDEDRKSRITAVFLDLDSLQITSPEKDLALKFLEGQKKGKDSAKAAKLDGLISKVGACDSCEGRVV